MVYIAVITCSVFLNFIAKLVFFMKYTKKMLVFWLFPALFVLCNEISAIILTFRPAKPRHHGPCYQLYEVARQQEYHH